MTCCCAACATSLSRLEEGAFTLHLRPTDVTELARATADRLRPQLDDARVSLDVTARGPVTVDRDPDRITQILVVLGNALTACDPHGHVSLSVHAAGGSSPGAVVRVTDDGIGIDAGDLDRIFARFERIEHPGRPAPAGGSGIGLTIARGIARAHGGDITAESPAPGKGATFTPRVPREPA